MSGTFMEGLLATIADRGRALLDLDRQSEGRDPRQLAEALLSGQGEASGTALARELLDAYQAMDEAAKIDFLNLLATSFGPDAARLDAAITAYRESPNDETAGELHSAA